MAILTKGQPPPQNIHKSMHNNIFSQAFTGIRQQTTEASQRAQAKNQEKEVAFLLSLRNDKTNADEAIIWIQGVMWVITGFVVYLGFNYYVKTFEGMFNPEIAFAFAVGLPSVVEVAKILLLKRGLRSIGFGWIAQTWSNFGYWTTILIVGIGAFYWSYTISTGGIREVALQEATQKAAPPPLSIVIAENTADIDTRIAALDKSDQQAAGMKTKKGRTNWYGQSIQQKNAEARASLSRERETIVQQATQQYNKTGAATETKISAWAAFIQRFGGWGEWAVAFCLIATLFFEMRLKEMNAEALQNAAFAQDAKQKAISKIYAHAQKNPGFSLKDGDLQAEINKAMSMNGDYEKTPFTGKG